MKHTPGPWNVATNPGGPENQPAFPSVRDNTGNPHGQDIVCMPLGNSETVKANARLIAAAPEMLEALQEAIPALVDMRDEAKNAGAWVSEGIAEDALSAARAAVAKATGE